MNCSVKNCHSKYVDKRLVDYYGLHCEVNLCIMHLNQIKKKEEKISKKK